MIDRYRAFGLSLSSELPLSALTRDSCPPALADISVVKGEVEMPSHIELVNDMLIGRCGEALCIGIEEIARFRTGPTRIVVDPDAGVSTSHVNIYLSGTVLGVALHQRGLLPMHGNAVVVNGRAYLFCGDSGAGKSTLAAWFAQRGHALLTDDVCALDVNASGVTAFPGIPRLKLWRDALALLGRSTSEGVVVPWSDGKYELGSQANMATAPVPVAAIYHLRQASDGRRAGIHAASGIAAANVITANIYRRRLADISGRTRSYMAAAATLVGSVPIFEVNRRWGLEHFHAEAEAAEAHMLTHARQERSAVA